MAQDAGVQNIAELRKFGRNLNLASNNLNTLFQQLSNQMHQVCESWNDDQNRKFMSEFDQERELIKKISQQMQQYSSHIGRSCDILEQYKNQKL